MNEFVEVLEHGGLRLAYIIRAGWMPEKSTFITPHDLGQQLGMIVYGAGQSIIPHDHKPIVRQITGSTECVIVRKGACEVDFYDRNRTLVTSRSLRLGDIVLLLDGGHGFRMTEDTVLFEVKQGPFGGDHEKDRFTPGEGRSA